jgi:HK97 family phage major capsid protein
MAEPVLTVPTEPEELEAVLADQEKVNAFFAAGKGPELVRNYAANYKKAHTEYLVDLRERVETIMNEWLKDPANQTSQIKRLNMQLDPERPPRPANIALYNKRAPGAGLVGMFEDSASYFQTIINPNRTAEAAKKLQELKAYSEKVPSEGGLLVPEEFRSEILRVSLEQAIVRPRARVVPMSGGKLHFPKIDDTSHVSSVYGGVIAYWVEEGADLQESSASFGATKLEPWKLTLLAKITNELVRDFGGMTTFIEQIFPEAVAHFEDLAFISGNGAGQPLGALSSGNSGLLVVNGETNQTASTIVWQNVIRMYSRMLPSSINRAVWLASPDTFVELATMALSVGTGGSAVWLTDGTGAPTLTLLGRPVIMTEKAPAALGTQGDLSFVDWSMYLIGDRQAMELQSSEHVNFISDKTVYRVIERVDGRPWVDSPFTPHNNSATLSPYVQLATR